MSDEGVVVLGIPIPSSSPAFLGIVAVHVAAGLTCTIAGIVAMIAPKRPGRHPFAGTVYYWRRNRGLTIRLPAVSCNISRRRGLDPMPLAPV